MNDNYMGGGSDSDVSMFDEDEEPAVRGKTKGKGKAVEGRKGDKGKGKAKEVSYRRTSSMLNISEPEVDFLQQPYAWEASYTRSWDTVQEDEAGSLQGAVQDLIARGRRKRCVFEEQSYSLSLFTPK